MNTNQAVRSFPRRLAAAAAVAALTLALSTPVLADRKHHRRHHGHGHGHGHAHHHVYHAPPAPVYARPIYVPTVIRPAYVETYRPYYRGVVHYAPHGHAHAMYSFPVWHDHALVHETRHYCGGELFLASGGYGSPQFSLRIAF